MIRIKWSWNGCCDVDQLAVLVAAVVYKSSCCNDFWSFFSVWPLYGDYYELLFGKSPIFHPVFLEHIPYLWTQIIQSIYHYFYFLSPHNRAQTNKLSQTNIIRQCGTNISFTTGNKKTVVLAMVHLYQFLFTLLREL